MAAIRGRWRIGSLWRDRRARRRRQARPAADDLAGRFSAEVRGDAEPTTLEVAGEVDVATSPRLAARVRALLDDTTGPMIVDLTDVTFMDSTGLSLLLTLHRDAQAARRPLAIVCPEGPVRLLLAVSGVESELPLYASRREATDALG
jgi:anti-sigma B factor antagonist